MFLSSLTLQVYVIKMQFLVTEQQFLWPRPQRCRDAPQARSHWSAKARHLLTGGGQGWHDLAIQTKPQLGTPARHRQKQAHLCRAAIKWPQQYQSCTERWPENTNAQAPHRSTFIAQPCRSWKNTAQPPGLSLHLLFSFWEPESFLWAPDNRWQHPTSLHIFSSFQRERTLPGEDLDNIICNAHSTNSSLCLYRSNCKRNASIWETASRNSKILRTTFNFYSTNKTRTFTAFLFYSKFLSKHLPSSSQQLKGLCKALYKQEI